MKRSIAALLFCCGMAGLSACGKADPEESDDLVGEAACASIETKSAIQNTLFDSAVEQFEGEPLAINDMRRVAKSKLDFVVLDGTDEEIGRTNCSARLKVTIPANLQKKFAGDDEILADISYFTQNAADGSGRVTKVEGLDFAVKKIVDVFSGNAAKTETQPTQPKPEPKQEKLVTFNPGFRCNGKLNRVEKMICTDQSLSQLDRQLNATYDGVMLEPDHEGNRIEIKRRQDAWRAQRDRCPDKNCVEKAYRERIDFLYIHY